MTPALIMARVFGTFGSILVGVSVGFLVGRGTGSLLGLGVGYLAFAVVLGVTEPASLQVVKHAPESQSGSGPGGEA